jgi:hypothetical protein
VEMEIQVTQVEMEIQVTQVEMEIQVTQMVAIEGTLIENERNTVEVHTGGTTKG